MRYRLSQSTGKLLTTELALTNTWILIQAVILNHFMYDLKIFIICFVPKKEIVALLLKNLPHSIEELEEGGST